MMMLKFQHIPSSSYTPGVAIATSDNRFLRLTHVFNDCVYGIWVREPEFARYARRPQRFSLLEFESLIEKTRAVWGKISLPPALRLMPDKGSIERAVLDHTWDTIQPLIEELEEEHNLEPLRYSQLIRRRAALTRQSFTTLYRLIIRYYYFGSNKYALLSLPTGRPPWNYGDPLPPRSGRRRGRQPAISEIKGRNEFIVTEDDINDMIVATKRHARRPTFISQIHVEYLAREFHKRHPNISDAYEKGKIPEPVTQRQFRYYITKYGELDEATQENIRTRKRNPGYAGAHHARGPGDIYEIDATGGRMHLRSTCPAATPLRTPIIYLLIDRWSRFVVSAYISLQPASYEELKYALLIAFTSRKSRFALLGIDVDDQSWPRGVVCATLVADRGSELISEAMMGAVADCLRITATFLPPLTPDGKAIIERFIRSVKDRQAAAGTPGTFMDRPLDPKSRKRFEKARLASVNTLADAYRELITIIKDHNITPHRSLRKRAAQAGILPTPQAMYEWGLEHISGLRTCALSDDHIYEILLETCTGSLGQGIVRYGGMHYTPANDVARRLAQQSTHQFRAIQLKLDKTAPIIAYIPQPGSEWAEFAITRGGLDSLRGTTLAEQESLSHQSLLLWSVADQESRAKRVVDARISAENRTAPSPVPKDVDQAQVKQMRRSETQNLKAALRGKSKTTQNAARPRPTPNASPDVNREEALVELIERQIKRRLEGKK